jgi:hypothetical protein
MAMVILYPVPLCPFKHASMFKVFRFFPCQFFCDKLSISLKADLNTAEVFLPDGIGLETFRVSALQEILISCCFRASIRLLPGRDPINDFLVGVTTDPEPLSNSDLIGSCVEFLGISFPNSSRCFEFIDTITIFLLVNIALKSLGGDVFTEKRFIFFLISAHQSDLSVIRSGGKHGLSCCSGWSNSIIHCRTGFAEYAYELNQ